MQTSGRNPKRGELYWLEFEAARGSEQAGRRPGLVVSNDIGNRFSAIVIVAPVTSRLPPRRYPVHVRVQPTSRNGLSRESVVMCEQLITVSKERLERRIGELGQGQMEEVDGALRTSLALS